MADKHRHPVAQGGMWNIPKTSYSKETQSLLKDMMKESKLTNFQQRQLNQAMTGGGPLPPRVHPSSSAKPNLPAQPQSRQLSGPRIDPREYTHSTRKKDQIEATGAYERETFAPAPMTKFRGFYEKDKERLANIMAYGEDLPKPDKKKLLAKARQPSPPLVDRFDELQEEIAERRNFLEEMESLGQGDQYKHIIETEVSRLIREMEVIDRKRDKELQERIRQEKLKQAKAT